MELSDENRFIEDLSAIASLRLVTEAATKLSTVDDGLRFDAEEWRGAVLDVREAEKDARRGFNDGLDLMRAPVEALGKGGESTGKEILRGLVLVLREIKGGLLPMSVLNELPGALDMAWENESQPCLLDWFETSLSSPRLTALLAILRYLHHRSVDTVGAPLEGGADGLVGAVLPLFHHQPDTTIEMGEAFVEITLHYASLGLDLTYNVMDPMDPSEVPVDDGR